MRAVVQRVSQASVAVDGEIVGAIEEPGLLVLVGVTHDDTPEQAARLAAKSPSSMLSCAPCATSAPGSRPASSART